MAMIALLIGVVLVVAAIRDTHGELFTALGQDVPGFAVWAAAIFALAVIGFIPGLKPVSRGLLALVIVVIVVTNYQAILGGFQSAWQGAAGQGAAGSGGQVASTAGASTFDPMAMFNSFSSVDTSSLTAADTSQGQTAVNG